MMGNQNASGFSLQLEKSPDILKCMKNNFKIIKQLHRHQLTPYF